MVRSLSLAGTGPRNVLFARDNAGIFPFFIEERHVWHRERESLLSSPEEKDTITIHNNVL
jgi:hypothetical protein